MNKKLIILFFFTPLIAKDIYYTRSGIVSFFSSTPIEDIKAIKLGYLDYLDSLLLSFPV